MTVSESPTTAPDTVEHDHAATRPPMERRLRRRAPSNQRNAVEPLIPAWAIKGGKALYTKGGIWSTIGVPLGLLCVGLGALGMFGGGYTSIQGLRIPVAMLLAVFGFPMDAWSFPSLAWWLIPVATNGIQLFARRVPALRRLWWPSVILDTTTTAVFSGFAVLVYIFGFTGIVAGLTWPPPPHIIGTGVVMTGVSFIVTIASEKLLVGGVALAWASLTGAA